MGASAGGVETLREVVRRFPADFPAAICIVLHIAPSSPSALAGILGRAGVLPCRAARDGDALTPGQILVAQPDRHLEVEDGRVRLTVGPRENNTRPAIDVLFRTAAHERGSGVVGVVLSGTRDDGTAGLAAIKTAGGLAVVQDPDDALYAGMPESAIANVAVDVILPANRIAAAIIDMVTEEVDVSDPAANGAAESDPDPHIMICPECGGVLSEREHASMHQWTCRVGHRYSPESLLDAQATDVEAALWTAVRALEDRALLLEKLGTHLSTGGSPRSAQRFARRAADARAQAELVRRALASAASSSLRSVEEADDGEESAA
jgi:two-component system chemotaxis response regulator CheB